MNEILAKQTWREIKRILDFEPVAFIDGRYYTKKSLPKEYRYPEILEMYKL